MSVSPLESMRFVSRRGSSGNGSANKLQVDTPERREGSSVEAEPSTGSSQQELPRQKRKWERRPELDLNAPVKPPTAYVAFSNAVREELDGKPFTEISRTAGRRWSLLPAEEKKGLEREALRLRGEYRAATENYKDSKAYKVS